MVVGCRRATKWCGVTSPEQVTRYLQLLDGAVSGEHLNAALGMGAAMTALELANDPASDVIYLLGRDGAPRYCAEEPEREPEAPADPA